jgi:hypothetical protein
MKMTFQEIIIIATSPCITIQLRDVDTICRRSWYIAAHIWKIYDFKIEVIPFIINKIRLIRSLKKFIFRYQDLVAIYSVSAGKIIGDGFSYSENVITTLPNSEQSHKGKVKTHKYIDRQNQSTTGKL